MAAKQGQPSQGVASSRGSGAVAGTCHLHLAAANHGRCRGDPQPPPPGSTGAQPSGRSLTPKGAHRAARMLATPEQHGSVSLIKPHARGGRQPGSEVLPPPDPPGLCPAGSTDGGRGKGEEEGRERSRLRRLPIRPWGGRREGGGRESSPVL
ncbi:hypothetical protein VPH35_052415 [Triticum aestivum]|uniref:Uncharacterized protein n=1 Tax=Triticum turgidum subsp. durum TaxID=4567 RepID=A0A9R1QIQ9_TRITD|nr:unnamed protein product [Triticum turgidum subsp. durum]